jgi:hypothetical protein
MTSHNPTDVREGYCDNCHAFTRDEPEVERLRRQLAGAVWALNEALGYLRLRDDRESAISVIEHGLRSAGVDPSKPLGGQ